MNADKVKIVANRRALLSNLNLFYPTAVSIESLYRTVCGYDPTYGKDLFVKDIVYFGDKGWLVFVDEALGGGGRFMSRIIRLSAAGKEVAEKTITDPAMEI
jgi:hypothetical protein